MYDKLTKKDIEKMEQEVEHRKLVVRKEALEDVINLFTCKCFVTAGQFHISLNFYIGSKWLHIFVCSGI